MTNDTSLEKILSLCYVIPMGDPLDPACIWGAVPSLVGRPGIGKSARVKQSGKHFNLPVGIIELGGRQPEDASGAPFLTKDDKLVIACLLGAVNELSEAGKGILFLDETNWARPATQGAFLSMVQDRRVGDTIFSNMIRIVLASNDPSSAGGGHVLIPPMANRCFHFLCDHATEEEENAYLMGQGQRAVTPIEDAEQIVKEKWQDVWGKMVGQMIGFKRFKSDYILQEPKPGDPQHHKAWPSPRSRENALRALTTIRILETTINDKGQEVISPLEDVFVEAACGPKMAVDWAIYREQSRLPDPLDMLKNGWKVDKTRLDRTMAAYSSCAAYLMSRSDLAERDELAVPMFELLPQLLEAGLADIAVSIAQPLVRAGFTMNKPGKVGETVKKILVLFSKRGLNKQLENGF